MASRWKTTTATATSVLRCVADRRAAPRTGVDGKVNVEGMEARVRGVGASFGFKNRETKTVDTDTGMAAEVN